VGRGCSAGPRNLGVRGVLRSAPIFMGRALAPGSLILVSVIEAAVWSAVAVDPEVVDVAADGAVVHPVKIEGRASDI